MRRNVSMLVDAGVDVIYFDVTNAFTYSAQYTGLMNVYTQIRNEGGQTPQIVFLAHSLPANTISNLYDNIYSKNLYFDLWFQWQGKPLILGYDEDNLTPGEAPLSQQIKDFFTFCESWAWDAGFHKWQCLDRHLRRDLVRSAQRYFDKRRYAGWWNRPYSQPAQHR